MCGVVLHIERPQVGDWYFIRIRGSAALHRVKCQAFFSDGVWQLMTIDGGLADRQETTDFEFVAKFPIDQIVGVRKPV